MIIIFHRSFEKQYKKLPLKIQKKVKERNILFTNDLFDPRLNNHALSGKYTGYRSINMTGDTRIVYKLLKDDTALFVAVGTHSELYE